MTETIKRIFIVGCARSGTTLLQAMLSSHPEVFGFPETFYFAHARVSPRYSGRSRWWGNRRQAIYALQDARRRLGIETPLPPWLHLHNPESIDRHFLRTLDALASQAGKTIWSEKTPGHINCIERISAVCPDALFIHMLRDGRDVVASLEHLHRDASKDEQQVTWNLDASIAQWNACRQITQCYETNPTHHTLRYEDLLATPAETISALCSFLDLHFTEDMLDHQNASSQILGNDAKNEWRRDVLRPRRPTHLIKYQQLFSENDQRDIESRLLAGGTTKT